MKILDSTQIKRKLARLSIEVLEHHVEHDEIVLVGINNNGYETASQLKSGIDAENQGLKVELRRVTLSPANPLHGGISFEGNVSDLDGKHVIIVDDVANTGRTAFYAAKPILEVMPSSLQVCVLVDRMHKSWPVSSDYVGLTLSTTIQQDIRVHFGDDWRVEVF